jgi:tripeptide aminopeptidase
MSYKINQDRLLNIFEDLIKIDSPSGREETISVKILEILSKLNLNIVSNPSIDESKKNLLLVFPEYKTTNSQSIMYCAHMDTVESTKDIKLIKDKNIIKTDGNTILGADDKSGIAAIIETLFVLSENNLPHPQIEICLTAEEEVGLKGSYGLDFSKIHSKTGFVLDCNGDIGKVITQAPSQASFEVNIYGKSAHAGVEPENGKNAIVLASKIISSIPIGRIDDITTSNIGIISGGKATNIVPDHVNIKGEIRSLSNDKLDLIDKIYNDAFLNPDYVGFKVNYDAKKVYCTFNIDKNNDIINKLNISAKKINIPIDLIRSGGGSDANVFNQIEGMNCVVLSTGMEKVHTFDEYINTDNLLKLTNWLIEIALEYSNNN